jgi:2-methylcitrate dehydratase
VRLLEDKTYSAGYAARDQRSTGNAIEVEFDDGSASERVEVLYSAGHPVRRSALQPMLQAKFEACLAQVLEPAVIEQLRGLFLDHERLACVRVRDFITLLVPRRPSRGE